MRLKNVFFFSSNIYRGIVREAGVVMQWKNIRVVLVRVYMKQENVPGPAYINNCILEGLEGEQITTYTCKRSRK